MDDAPHNPATIPAPGSYHWTPRLQREFLEAFATNGSVKISAANVCMSPAAVYQLKQRPEGAAFKLGCAAALLIARGRLVDELLDRAIWGHDETTELLREEGRSFAKRRRIDSRLGLAMLARLDKMVETRARAGEDMFAQIIAGDWPGFLSLFDAVEALAPGGAGVEALAPDGAGGETPSDAGDAIASPPEGLAAVLALWLAGRDNRANPLAALWKNTSIANEVAQISADPAPRPPAERSADDRAAEMTVWTDHETGQRRTDFPPPAGFIGIEVGEFGDYHYERSMDPDEEDAFRAACEADLAPLRAAGEIARRAFFALPAAANDPAPEGGNRKQATG